MNLQVTFLIVPDSNRFNLSKIYFVNWWLSIRHKSEIGTQKWVDHREDRPIELGTRRTATIEEPE